MVKSIIDSRIYMWFEIKKSTLLILFLLSGCSTNKPPYKPDSKTSQVECYKHSDCVVARFNCGIATAIKRKSMGLFKIFDHKLNNSNQCLAPVDISGMKAYCWAGKCSLSELSPKEQEIKWQKWRSHGGVVYGSMDPDDIRQVLRDNVSEFRKCIEGLTFKNWMTRTLKLIFTINKDGNVIKNSVLFKEPRIDTHLEAAKCLKNHLGTLKFSKPLGGGTIDVKQPFNFNVKKDR